MAEVWARNFPKIGSYITELEIPDAAPIRMRQTGEEGHYSLWGTPEQLLALVRRVYPVRPQPS